MFYCKILLTNFMLKVIVWFQHSVSLLLQLFRLCDFSLNLINHFFLKNLVFAFLFEKLNQRCERKTFPRVKYQSVECIITSFDNVKQNCNFDVIVWKKIKVHLFVKCISHNYYQPLFYFLINKNC